MRARGPAPQAVLQPRVGPCAAVVLAVGGLLGGLAACDDDVPAGAVDAQSEQRRDAAELAVCRFNSDCLPGFYCKARRCDLDCRANRDCPPENTCQSGQCIPPTVEPPAPCINDTNCGPPDTVCESGVCVDGCIAAGCPADDEGRLQRCSATTGRCGTLDCRVDGCVATDVLPDPVCEQSTGLCIPPPDPVEVCGEMCREDEYCDPDLMRCVLRPARCTPQSCAANQRCDEGTGQCVDLPFDCRRDGGCRAPQVCDAATGRCADPAPFDCNLGDQCPQGFECVVLTGECAPEVPNTGALGEPCDAAATCQSNLCLGLGGVGFCTQPCCREDDCPPGFGCLYASAAGGGACMPAERFPSNFTTPAGGACGAGFNDCRTGLCLSGRCQDACCSDANCDGFTCVVLPTSGGSAAAICDIPNLLGGPAGSICFGDLDCENRVCLIHPDATPDNVFGYCADTCCTHADCAAYGPGFGCGLTGFFDERQQLSFTINACAFLPFGDRADGEVCARDADCQSGACMEGQCRQPCCNDRTCGNLRCLPRVNTENVLQRVCVPPDPVPGP